MTKILQAVDPERLRNKEGLRGYTWIFLGRGNRTGFSGVLVEEWGLEQEGLPWRREQENIGKMTGI